MTKSTRILPFLLIAATLCILDQLSKTHIKALLGAKPGRQITLIPGFANLVYSHNTGGAFSLLDNTPIFFIIFPSILMVAMIVLLIKFSGNKKIDTIIPISISIMLGGAAGNMLLPRT